MAFLSAFPHSCAHAFTKCQLLLKEVARVRSAGGGGGGGALLSSAAICLLCSDLPGEAGRQLLMQDAARARCLASGFGEEILQSLWLSSCCPSEELRFLWFPGIRVRSDSRGYLCSETSCPQVSAARGLLGAPELAVLLRENSCPHSLRFSLLFPSPCLQFM